MRVCPRCGHENPGNYVVCDKCAARLAPTAASRPRYPRIYRDSESEICISQPWWVYALGAVMILCGIMISVTTRFLLTPVGIVAILLGILLLVRSSTRITFDQPPGYMTMRWGVRRYWPYFVRTTQISKEEAREARVRGVDRTVGGMYSFGTVTVYQVRVMMSSGKEVTLHEDSEQHVADYLARRIRQFGSSEGATTPPL